MERLLFERPGDGADYERLVAVQDGASRLRAVIVVHRLRDGLAAGGIRRWAYAGEAEAVADAQRLAWMMSLKFALADLPSGGAKTVVLDHPALRRAEAYRALGRAVEELGGRYLCGPDVGTGEGELAAVRETSRYVNPEGNDPNAATAAGVLAGIRGVLRFLDGDVAFAGRRFAVQGLGGIGRAVAAALVEGGGEVVGADPAPAAQEVAKGVGVRLVPLATILQEPCDVLVPCALGGVLTAEVAAAMPARGVCGSANNQLKGPEAASALHARGIAYAPDFAVNAGAAAEGVLTWREGATEAVRAKARERMAGVEGTVLRILQEARDRDVPGHEVALAMAKARLDSGA